MSNHEEWISDIHVAVLELAKRVESGAIDGLYEHVYRILSGNKNAL